MRAPGTLWQAQQTAIFICLLASAALARSPVLLLRTGTEVELGHVQDITPSPRRIDPGLRKGLLERVRARMGGWGEVQWVPYRKPGFTNRHYMQASYRDPENRTWAVVPEGVFSKEPLDGSELVTPPLESPQDFAVLDQVVADVEKEGKLVAGTESSVHYTYDVSDLIGPDDDASRVLDTILYLENHWPELYAAASPRRYGSLVNHYAMPLCYDQRALCEELSTLRKRGKPPITLDAIREVFMRHAEREIRLKYGDGPEAYAHAKAENFKKAFKYRSAQYRKLLELFGEKQIKAIEVRISDYRGVESMRRNRALFNNAIALGHQLEPGAGFRDPYRGIDPDLPRARAIEALNDAIVAVPEARYQQLLSSLQLPSRDYPRLGGIPLPLTYAARVPSGGKPSGIPEGRFRTQVPLPPTLTRTIPEAELAGWAHRLEQALFLKRLAENPESIKPGASFRFPDLLALSPSTAGPPELRLNPGVPELSASEQAYLLEKVGLANAHPELIQGFPGSENALAASTPDLASAMAVYVAQHEHHRALSPREKALLDSLGEETRRLADLALYSLDKAPFLSPLERNRLQGMRLYLLQEVAWAMQGAARKFTNPAAQRAQSRDFARKLTRAVKRYARDAELETLLDRSLFLGPTALSREAEAASDAAESVPCYEHAILGD